TDPACLAEWFSVNFGVACLRRLDGVKHFPEAKDGEVHDDGEMWSAALFKSRAQIGADVMDKLVLEVHFALSTNESFLSAFQAIIIADQTLFGGQHAATIRRIFIEQGLSRDLTAPANLTDTPQAVSISVDNPRVGGTYTDALDDSQIVSQPGAAGLRLHFTQI